MKKVWETAFVYIGLVIGAGFASGREILEYFNFSSRSDFTGIILAAVFFALIAYITMHLTNIYGVGNLDGFTEKAAGRAAGIIKIFMLLYMFCGFFIMLSGSGALFSKTFSINSKWGIFLLAFVCFVIFSFDIKGLVVMNTVMVPLMIVGMAYLCISSSLCGAVSTLSGFNRLRANPIAAALCYTGYNTITAGSVLVPVSAGTDKKTLAKASVISGAVLGLLIYTVWSTLNIYFESAEYSEMPLLDLAAASGKIYEIIYTAVLFMALCTTAVSHGYGILSKFRLEKTSDRVLASAVLCLTAAPLARIGFSQLIANIYSIFGFGGFIWLVLLLYAYISADKS